ncbi:MAG TPA: M48 family metallopeptidase [Thermoanaerobaculia bacterium]|nr:M48 family metallopeptidase [Thermoanaerobaculia bacterium]
MNKRKSSAALAVVLATCLAAGCGSGGAGNFNLISIEDEWQLGQQLSQEVAQQVRFNNDPAVNAYVREIGQKIVAASPAPFNQLPWDFHVVDDPAINAFAIPGGHVYVNTGLIAAAENASELAGVMAHEASHVVARHTTEAISRQYGLSILASLVLGQNAGALQQIAAEVVAGGAMARFSRDAEREADELGIAAMHRAGYDPRGMAAMFRVLLAHQQSEPGRLEQFFSTHPTTEARIRDAESRAAQLSSAGTVTDEPRFQDVRRRVASTMATR